MKTEYVRCSVCKELKPTDQECYQKRLKKYGSISKIEEQWVCRSCGKTPKSIANKINKEGLGVSYSERRKELQKKVNKLIRESIPYEI